MFKTTLALVGAGFLLYYGARGYQRIVERKYKALAFDAMQKAYAAPTAEQKQAVHDAFHDSASQA